MTAKILQFVPSGSVELKRERLATIYVLPEPPKPWIPIIEVKDGIIITDARNQQLVNEVINRTIST